MKNTGCEPFSRRDAAAIVLTCILWSLVAALIDPRGDFPLIDDWACGLPVRSLLERGALRLTDWTTATLITQVCWGTLFCLPTGFSFTALRISTLAAALIGLIAMYGLMRQLGASRIAALFATWTVGANAVYVCLSFTFMTDVPFISLFIISTALLIRGICRDRDGDIWLGLGAALASVFIRQIGLAVFLGFAVAYPFWRGAGRRWFVQALLPAALAIVALKAYERGMTAYECLPRVYYKYHASMAEFFSYIARGKLGAFKFVLAKAWDLLLFLGLYTLPFSLLCWPSWLARLSRRGRMLELGCIGGLTVAATAAFAATGGEVLRHYNIIYDFGAGPRIGGDSGRIVGWPGRLPFAFNLGLGAAAVLGMVLALRALGQVVRRIAARPRTPGDAASRACAVLLIATCAFYQGAASFSFLFLYDRYMLGILPLALALIWEGWRTDEGEYPDAPFRLRPIGVAAGLVGLVLSLAFATAATHDYLDWSRARWAADRGLAEELAIPATDIDGGWEYNNYFASLDRLYKTYHERGLLMSPQEKKGALWGVVLDRPYRVSPRLAPGYESIRKVPLSPWLPLAPTEFIVSKRIDPSSPAR